MERPRPNALPYSARDGVVETFLASIHGEEPLPLYNFITRSIGWSNAYRDNLETEKRGYRILDSFLSDAMSHGNLGAIFTASNENQKTRILLAHPASDFARARAKAVGKSSAEKKLLKGLEQIAKGLGKEVEKEWNDNDFVEGEWPEAYKSLNKRLLEKNVEIHFYNGVAGSPLYIMNDLAIVGRFGTGSTSADLRWELVVDDPRVDNDLYDLLHDEFEKLWRETEEEELGGNQIEIADRGEDIKGSNQKSIPVFISHSSEDADVAEELKKKFKDLHNIDAFVASLDIVPGDKWNEEIKDALLSAKELVVLISNNSDESDWVKVECGAAWVLDKVITPATISKKFDTMGFIHAHQAINIATTKGKDGLVDAVVSRLKQNGVR